MAPELILVFIFGCVFISVLLVIAVAIPEPTAQQMFIFRVVLALSAAGIGAVVPGFLELQGKVLEFSLRAGGALALFILIYRINPPSLLAKTITTEPKDQHGNVKVGFIQPGWTVHRDVIQAQGSMTVISSNTNQSSATLAQIFTDLEELIKHLPADDKDAVVLIVSQAKIQAEMLQRGDTSNKCKDALEKRLRSLYTIDPDIGSQMVANLATPSSEIAIVIQNIAKRVLDDLKDKNR